MKKTLGLSIAIIFLCNSLAFAGLHRTQWCDPDGYYFEETDTTYPCQTFYYGVILSSGSPYDMVPGLFYIDLDPYYIFWTTSLFLMFGTFWMGVGEYSISEGTLSYATFSLNSLVPILWEKILTLSNTDETNVSLEEPIMEPEGCL